MVFSVADILGRRRELLLGSALYFVGTVCSLASDAFGLIVCGRVVYGFGIAFSMHAAPLYISEMAPSDIRGFLISLKEGFIVGGILIGFAVTALVEAAIEEESQRFRALWALPGLVALVIFGGMAAMPPSPRWLMHRAFQCSRSATSYIEFDSQSIPADIVAGRMAALDALRRFRPHLCEEEIQSEIDEIEATLRQLDGAKGSWVDMCSARRALLAGIGLVTFQQLTGQPSVLYNQEAIFKTAGFGGFAASASVVVGVFKLVATLVTVFIVDKVGRRPLLFIGISMMLGALVLLAFAFQTSIESGSGDMELSGSWSAAVVMALILYVSGYQVGFGPIAWLIISEVFPLKTRGKAMSCAAIVNFGFNLLVTFTLKQLQEAFDTIEPGKGQSFLFLLYAVMCVVSICFTYVYVPETKGKSLEEVEAMLR